MSANIWSSRADVLNDLREVTGGNTRFADLDDYVAVGERPPPDRRESIDEDEIQNQFGILGCGGDSYTGPDLDGISQMLQLVNEDASYNEPKTIFRSTLNDEIRISKLNPNVTEFVPSGCRKQPPQLKQKSLEKNTFKSPTKPKPTNQENSEPNEEIKISDKSVICDVKKEKDEVKTLNPPLSNEAKNNSASNSKSSLIKANVSSNDINLEKKVDVSNMKSEEIEEMKVKIKSKIIGSSGDSIQNKKQKNVAIAALLRLYTASPAPPEKSVKLITPDYFEAPPAKTEDKEKPEVKDQTEKAELEETPSTSTSSIPVAYRDPFVQESIAKVNDWFDNASSPKPEPKPLPVQLPVAAAVLPAPVPVAPSQFRDALSFKKKNTSTISVNSRKSETSVEKKKQAAAFVPSSYANDLLQKYEKNAKKKKPPKEDWRVTLERQLQEKDEEIKKKLREKEEATSPNPGSGN